MQAAAPLLDWQKGWIDDQSQFKLVVAGRQSGKSHVFALDSVMESVGPKRLNVLLSRGERQSIELMEKVKAHKQAMGVVTQDSTDFFRDTSILQHTATFPNNSRIIALPANPDTARGYSGNIFLDEFGLHKDSREIWGALFPSTTRGYKVRVASTFKGTANKFYELAKVLGLHTGVRPDRQPVQAKGWSGHWVDIYMVQAQCAALGIRIDAEGLRVALDDEEVWAQEYCNVPMSGAENWIPLELILACESSEAGLEWDGRSRPRLSAGWDFARKRDGSVIFLGEPAADLLVVCGAKWLDRLKFAEQRSIAREVAAAVAAGGGRFCIDATGIGAQIAEELRDEFPCVEAVEFGARTETGARDEAGKAIMQPVKERMAVDLKRRFEEHTLRIPESSRIRRGVQAVKRYIGPTGQVRFDAARTDEGHADEFWALALLAAAVAGARNYTPISDDDLVGDPVMAGLLGRVF